MAVPPFTVLRTNRRFNMQRNFHIVFVATSISRVIPQFSTPPRSQVTYLRIFRGLWGDEYCTIFPFCPFVPSRFVKMTFVDMRVDDEAHQN